MSKCAIVSFVISIISLILIGYGATCMSVSANKICAKKSDDICVLICGFMLFCVTVTLFGVFGKVKCDYENNYVPLSIGVPNVVITK